MNLPNKITVFRMFIAPLFLLVYFADLKFGFLLSAAIFTLGAVTDAVDGRIARRNNIVTNFGKLLDPIADKMLVTAGLLSFLKDGLCNIWIVMIILTREFAVTSVRMIAASQGSVIPANIGGKIKTVLQMVSFVVIMLLCEANRTFTLDLPVAVISNILLGVTAVAAVVSGLICIFDSRKVIDFKK